MPLAQQAEQKMRKAIDVLRHDFQKIRAGRASPSLLEDIVVDYYGTPTPLKQLATILSEDARTLSIQVWDKGVHANVEKAIRTSDLGLNPVDSGTLLRIPLPAMTEESRKNYQKKARQDAENARIAVRNCRRDAMHHIKEEAEGEDHEHQLADEIQKVTDKVIAEIDKLLEDKEKDLAHI